MVGVGRRQLLTQDLQAPTGSRLRHQALPFVGAEWVEGHGGYGK
jgi:hypothetical protein